MLLLLLITDIKTQQCVSQWDIHFFVQFSFPQRSASLIHLYSSLLFPFHHTPFTYITQPSCYGHYQTISSIRKHCQATLSSWPPHNQSGQQRSGSRAQIHTPRTWVSTGLKWALDAYGYFWQRTWPPPLGNASPARCLSNMGLLSNIAVNNPVESILNY